MATPNYERPVSEYFGVCCSDFNLFRVRVCSQKAKKGIAEFACVS